LDDKLTAWSNHAVLAATLSQWDCSGTISDVHAKANMKALLN
jgi:hypothetical protein